MYIMKAKYLLGFVVLLTTLALVNSRFELFNSENISGVLFTGLSFFYLPGHVLAMVMTNQADSPDLWAMVIGYSTQAILIFFIVKTIFIKNNDT